MDDQEEERAHLERIGYTRTGGVKISANRHISHKDLAELRELVPDGVLVADADNEYRLKSVDVIIFVQWALGLGMTAYFTAFMGTMGKKHAEALGSWFRKKATHFETMEGFRFYKGNWVGQHRGVNVEVAVNEKDHAQLIEAFRRFDQVVPLLDDIIDANGTSDLRLVRIIYASRTGRWILNNLEFKNGRVTQAPLDGTWVQDDMAFQ